MSLLRRASYRWPVVAAAVVGVLAGGCSMDDVELNGGIFNALGVNNSVKAKEPKLAERAPLVVPPTLQRLPEPGTQPEAQATDMTASINDPDRQARVSQADLQKQQAEYCKTNYELAKARGDNDADQAAGPLGPCRTSILTAVKKWNEGDPVEEAE